MEEILNELLKKLKGLRWFIISGFAIEIYTKGKRRSDDIDLVVHEKDLEEFARRVGSKIKKRDLTKEGYVIQDLAIEFKIKEKEIEVTGGYPKERMINKTFDKLFDKKIRKDYKNFKLWVCPIEELIVLKASLRREKDLDDLRLLKDFKYDPNFVKEVAKDCGAEGRVLDVLNKEGYEII